MYGHYSDKDVTNGLLKDADAVTMGLVPSADQLHQGHYVTLTLALSMLEKRREKKSRNGP